MDRLIIITENFHQLSSESLNCHCVLSRALDLHISAESHFHKGKILSFTRRPAVRVDFKLVSASLARGLYVVCMSGEFFDLEMTNIRGLRSLEL